jgi:hypothetical protein
LVGPSTSSNPSEPLPVKLQVMDMGLLSVVERVQKFNNPLSFRVNVGFSGGAFCSRVLVHDEDTRSSKVEGACRLFMKFEVRPAENDIFIS